MTDIQNDSPLSQGQILSQSLLAIDQFYLELDNLLELLKNKLAIHQNASRKGFHFRFENTSALKSSTHCLSNNWLWDHFTLLTPVIPKRGQKAQGYLIHQFCFYDSQTNTQRLINNEPVVHIHFFAGDDCDFDFTWFNPNKEHNEQIRIWDNHLIEYFFNSSYESSWTYSVKLLDLKPSNIETYLISPPIKLLNHYFDKETDWSEYSPVANGSCFTEKNALFHYDFNLINKLSQLNIA